MKHLGIMNLPVGKSLSSISLTNDQNALHIMWKSVEDLNSISILQVFATNFVWAP